VYEMTFVRDGAMKCHEATIVPFIVRPCEWHDMPFAKVQALPRNAKPVTTYANQDEAWLEVVQGIKRVVESWNWKIEGITMFSQFIYVSLQFPRNAN
jgi:hypothetical protein